MVEHRDGSDDPTTLAKIPIEIARSRALSLLVMSPGGTSQVALPDRGEVVLGRGQDCDVRIEDAKLSRKHAKLITGARIELVDLGSLNGTFIRELRIPPNEPTAVTVGDSVGIGSTVLVVQRAARSERPRHVWAHGYLEARLDEECARAARGGHTFALLRLRLEHPVAGADTEKDSTAPSMLAVWLRETDILAKYAPHEYEILLIDTPPAECDARAADLADKLRQSGLRFDLGVATYPRDGRTPEALVEHTSRALARRDGAQTGAAPSGVIPIGALERMDGMVRRVAAGTINVLVLGETGVGKEVLARRIHELSPRADKPNVSLNCAALSEALLESELFGHEKGAFTGAVQAKAGLLESANGGSFFLDEVGEMPLVTQAKLLRVLEQREVVRVGALRPRPIDVRFIAATNRNLEAEVAAGHFRQDLYFRLNGIALSLPPLRERVDEIEPLARLFADRACRAMGRAKTARFAPEAVALLRQYQWPGNIRELKNVIERAVLLCSGELITKDHLPVEKMSSTLMLPTSAPRLTSHAGPASAATLPPVRPPQPTQPWGGPEWDAVTDPGFRPPPPAPPHASPPQAPPGERERIAEALEKCGGNQSHAAKLLGISRGTLIKRIEEFGLPRPRKRGE